MSDEQNDEGAAATPGKLEAKIVTHYPPPEPDELPPPTFKQALIGYGSIILALVLVGVLLGVLMRVLR